MTCTDFPLLKLSLNYLFESLTPAIKLVHFATKRKDWIQQQRIHEIWVQPIYFIQQQYNNVFKAKQL